MKTAALLLVCAGVLLASDPDAGPLAYPGEPVPGRADVTIYAVNDYTVTLGGNPRGCDFADTFDALLVTDYTSDQIYNLDPDNGAIVSQLACPAGVPDVLGIIYQQTPGGNFVYINNWNAVTNIYKYDIGATSWSNFANPVSGEPRGMDLDEDNMIWCIEANNRTLYRFNTSGGNVSTWNLTELPNELCLRLRRLPLQRQHRHSRRRVYVRQLLLLRVRRHEPFIPWQRRRTLRCQLPRTT